MKNKKLNINKLKAGVILSYVTMGLSAIILIVYTPIMLNLLGPSEYGLYNLVSSVVSYLGLLNFGFGSAYIRYYSRYKVKNDYENIAKLNGMFLIIFIVIGLIAVLAGTIFVCNINIILGEKLSIDELSTAKILMIIMVFNMAISLSNTVFSSYIIANEEYIFQKSLQLLKNVGGPFLTLPVLLMGYGSIGMIIVTTIITIIIEISNIIFSFNKLKIKFNFINFDFYLMKEMAVFSSYIFMNMIIDQINWSVDKFILGRFRGTIEVAIYGLAAQLNIYYLSLSTAISNVFIPRVNKIVATSDDNKELTLLFTKIGRIQFIILSLICSGFIFLGKSFIYIWAGDNYIGAYPITLLLIIPVTIPLIQNLGIEIQKSKNMHQFRSWIYLLIAIINICLSIPLSKIFGGVGAATGTAVALLLGNGVIMNWYYYKKIKLDMKYFWKQIFKMIPALFVPIIIGILMAIFIDLYNVIFFVMFGFIYVVIFSISMWCWGMNVYEKDLIGKAISKLLKVFKLTK